MYNKLIKNKKRTFFLLKVIFLKNPYYLRYIKLQKKNKLIIQDTSSKKKKNTSQLFMQ